ncbi:MAG: hypothetical protein WCA49_17425 [Candidatus Sulfotelmatobacter sp.]
MPKNFVKAHNQQGGNGQVARLLGLECFGPQALDPEDDGPKPKGQHHRVAHHAAGGNEKCGREQRGRGGHKRRPGKPLRQTMCTQYGGERRQKKNEMQCPFGPSDDASSRCDVVRGKRRILGFVRHGHGIEEPINFESEWIERVLGDLPRHVDKQGVIDMESLTGKRKQTGEYSRRQKDVGKRVATFVRVAFGRRRHQAV